jgi:hypothetical protein
MNQTASRNHRLQAALFALLGLAIYAPILSRIGTAPSWFPDWLGAGAALAALLGALIVFWRAGALRIRFVVLFAASLVLALVVGQFLGTR